MELTAVQGTRHEQLAESWWLLSCVYAEHVCVCVFVCVLRSITNLQLFYRVSVDRQANAFNKQVHVCTQIHVCTHRPMFRAGSGLQADTAVSTRRPAALSTCISRPIVNKQTRLAITPHVMDWFAIWQLSLVCTHVMDWFAIWQFSMVCSIC